MKRDYQQRWFYDPTQLAFVRKEDDAIIYYHEKLYMDVWLSPNNIEKRDSDLDQYYKNIKG